MTIDIQSTFALLPRTQVSLTAVERGAKRERAVAVMSQMHRSQPRSDKRATATTPILSLFSRRGVGPDGVRRAVLRPVQAPRVPLHVVPQAAQQERHLDRQGLLQRRAGRHQGRLERQTD